MDAAEVRRHIQQWVENTLSVPSPFFNNLPPCPYSREALLNNKAEIRCVHGSELLQHLEEIGNTWDDHVEIILLVAEPSTIKPETLIQAIGNAKASFEARDLVSFFDHPHCTDPDFVVKSANGKYVLVGTQRLSNFIRAAKPLYKKNYFVEANKQFSVEEKLKNLS
jgi:hypothetical protein